MQKLFRAFSVNFRKFSNSQRVCQMPKPSNVLSELPEKLLAELFKHAVEHNLRDGEVLFRAGDVGDGCYRIQTGLVKVVAPAEPTAGQHVHGDLPGVLVSHASHVDMSASGRARQTP